MHHIIPFFFDFRSFFSRFPLSLRFFSMKKYPKKSSPIPRTCQTFINPMHEGSHQIFKMLFPHDYGVTQKSAGVHYCKANSERNKPISDWEEWQANTLGAAILLPENLIKQGMYLFSLGEKIECLNKIYYPSVYKRFDALADFLGCSKKALAIRMKQLGLLKKEYLDNPFDLVTVYPEVSEL